MLKPDPNTDLGVLRTVQDAVEADIRLFVSQTGEFEADIAIDNERKLLVCGGVELKLAERIIACVNACANIPTESLTAMGWRLAPIAGAKPEDVAKLILQMGEYKAALEKIATVPTILIFRSADDRDFNKLIQAPDDLGIVEAVPLADQIIAHTKATLNDWQWDDLEVALEEGGFKCVAWAHCDQEA